MKYRNAITKSDVLITLMCVVLVVMNLGGLGSAGRERARRMVCATNMVQLMRANHLYADDWDEQFCPVMMWNPDMPAGTPPFVNRQYRKTTWLTNPGFRNYSGLDEKQVVEWSYGVMPKEYQCPSNILFREGQYNQYAILVSYAYNVSDWSGATYGNDYSRNFSCYWCGSNPDCAPFCMPTPWMIGHKRTAIEQPSEKICFSESSEWWCTWDGANYEEGWDVVGGGTWEDYAATGVYGATLYRHNEGTNLAFYDGHVEYLRKEQVYIDNGEGTGDPPDRDGSGLWFVIPTWP